MNTRLTTYSADLVTVTFAGIIFEGFADGEFITIEMAEDDFKLKIGADGEGARAKTNNRSATMKAKLLQTSKTNTALNEVRKRDLASDNGAGVGVFQVRDRSSGVLLAHAEKAWIQHAPSPSRGREVTEPEWTFATHNLTLDASGNPAI